MAIQSFFMTILVLLIGTGLFCWLMTEDLGWGPIVYLVTFLGGIVAIGWAGIASLSFFNNRQ